MIRETIKLIQHYIKRWFLYWLCQNGEGAHKIGLGHNLKGLSDVTE